MRAGKKAILEMDKEGGKLTDVSFQLMIGHYYSSRRLFTFYRSSLSIQPNYPKMLTRRNGFQLQKRSSQYLL